MGDRKTFWEEPWELCWGAGDMAGKSPVFQDDPEEERQTEVPPPAANIQAYIDPSSTG